MFTPCSPRVRVTSRPTGSAPTADSSAVAWPRWARVIRTLPSAPATRSRNPETSSSRPASSGSSRPITSPTATTSNRGSPTETPQRPGRPRAPDAHRVAGEVGELRSPPGRCPGPPTRRRRRRPRARAPPARAPSRTPALGSPVQPEDPVDLAADLGDGRADRVGDLGVRRAQHLRGAGQVVGDQERAAADRDTVTGSARVCIRSSAASRTVRAAGPGTTAASASPPRGDALPVAERVGRPRRRRRSA